MTQTLQLAPDAVCILVCIVATITDLRSFTIPNWLVLAGLLVGLLLNGALGYAGGGGAGLQIALLASFSGGLLMLLFFGLLAAVNFLGMGDAKLAAAVGVLLRWPVALSALVYIAVAGGVIALLFALAKGRLWAVFGNIFRVGQRMVRRQGDAVELHRIPYALAILLGSGWAVAAKYLPMLRVP